ncbi:hypothetical protein PS15m_000064 [Mucor circinelloides]
MPRLSTTENQRSEKRSYRDIPLYIRKLVIEQIVMEGAIAQAEAARKYRLYPSSVRNILDAWHTESRMGKKPRGGRRREVLKFEDVHEEYIMELLDEDCTKTLDMIKEELMAKFPELQERGISTSGVWRFMEERIGFTLKRTKAVEERRNSEATIQQRYDYVGHRLPERGIAYKTNCIFVDKAGFNANLVRG